MIEKVSLSHYLSRLGAPRFIFAAVLLAAYSAAKPAQGLVAAAVVIVVLGLFFFHISRQKIEVTLANVTLRGGFTRQRTIERASLAGFYLTQYVEPGFGVFKRLILRDSNTGVKISLVGIYWDAETIDRVYKVLKKNSVEAISEPLTSAMVAKQFPVFVSYMERHPFKVAWMIIGGVVVLVAILVAIAYNL